MIEMPKVLIVEDNPQNLKLARVILQDAGYTTAEAGDAEAAEHWLAAGGEPDLILMDLGLPGKDGYTFTRELRQREGTRDVPILAVTSFAMKGDAELAISAGCSAYLTKPIHRLSLLRTIRSLIEGETAT